MSHNSLREPWRSFLRDLDGQLKEPTDLHCLGGFVVAECYGLTRATADIDILESRGTSLSTIATLAGRSSALLLASPSRTSGFTSSSATISVLAKLTRNIDRDRADVAAIAAGPGLDIDILRGRYADELRYKLGLPEREDLTLKLWIEIIEETKRRPED
jgi:hypothetical protein